MLYDFSYMESGEQNNRNKILDSILMVTGLRVDLGGVCSSQVINVNT